MTRRRLSQPGSPTDLRPNPQRHTARRVPLNVQVHPQLKALFRTTARLRRQPLSRLVERALLHYWAALPTTLRSAAKQVHVVEAALAERLQEEEE